MALLRREDAARRAPETQRRMEEAERRGTSDWIEVATAVQRRVARESLPAGASEGDVDARVAAMRYAAQRHPEWCHWVRFNRARVTNRTKRSGRSLTYKWPSTIQCLNAGFDR